MKRVFDYHSAKGDRAHRSMKRDDSDDEVMVHYDADFYYIKPSALYHCHDPYLNLCHCDNIRHHQILPLRVMVMRVDCFD